MRCVQCPRRCGAERTGTAGAGVCGMPSLPVVARAALHHWEEPPISGTRGAGTIFFSGCSLGCVYCQNEEISHRGVGKVISEERLREIFRELISQGAHNIDLVNPTHFSHVLERVLEEPLPVPVVWNSGGYDLPETLRRLEGKVDIYLPDLKYLDEAGAARYSGAPDYPERAKAVMDWVAEQFPPGAVYFSLMSQYTPWGRAAEYPEIDRKLRRAESRAARAYMENLGLAGFVQDEDSARREYTPAFDLAGV